MASKRNRDVFPGGWLVPHEHLQQYIADYIRDKPKDGEKYRREWLSQHLGKGKTAARKHKHKTQSTKQLATDLADTPETLRPWLEHLPNRPYCSDDLSEGLCIRSTKQALAYRYIQHNPPTQVWNIVLDVDHCIDLQSPVEPIPNAIAINPKNGHGHLFYFLKAGVTRTQAGRQAPLQLLAAVERGLCVKMDADPQYVGLVSKNLVNADWLVHSYHDRLWTLGELAEHLNLDAANTRRYVPKSPEEAFQTGRNVYLFEVARKWAYSEIRDYWAPNGLPRWQDAILGHLRAINRQFHAPLYESELRAIAKSIAKWTWRHITPAGLQDLIERTHTPEVQAERGRRATNQADAGRRGGLAATNQVEAGIASGKARRLTREQARATARLLRAQGYTQEEIAAELGVPRRTIGFWLSDDL
ncbi:replication initiation protein [Candidatus Igneacidithiobacillus taiwanensis]|uniref:replication initiation protein n=1 Tax=Candidatus Igneacidithiobacillus taiwanensis TaxID=1945924 RepID=UPI002899F476|nr:replication initiation protein [Candidatus Igneacidithiobacillus taiwanensis]